MSEESRRAHVRYEVRRSLRQVVEAAKHQGSLENLVRFPDAFVAFVIVEHATMNEAFALEMVTFQELRMWLGVLLQGVCKYGTAS